MHIAIVINTSWNIYNFRRRLLKEFLSEDWEVSAIAPRDAYTERLVELGCQYEEVDIKGSSMNPIRDYLLVSNLQSIFKRIKPDVLLLYTIKPNIYGSFAAQALGIPVINNISGLGTSFLTSGLLNSIVKVLYRKALKHSKIVFFQNNDDRQLFVDQNIISWDQTDLLPGSGVDLNYFKPQPKPSGKFCVLMVARLLVEKGVREYIQAAIRLSADEIPVSFILAGEYPSEHRRRVDRKILDHSTGSGVIRYLGHVDNIREVLAEANLVVLPSYREGTPKTLLEAAAMGKPLIAADVPGCREVVINGHNGYLCRPADANDLADKILAMVRLDPKQLEEFGRNSRVLAESKFSEEIVVSKYQEVINGIYKN